MIKRDLEPRLRRIAGQFPAVTLTGPRQSGKSTLCRKVFSKLGYVSLESPEHRAFAVDDPRAFLAQFPRGAVIDEVQRAPDTPSYLQGMVDDNPEPGCWVLTGSQNFALVDSVSQSLAGRTALLHLLPLTRKEVLRFDRHPETLEATLWHGGYPRIFDRALSPTDWLSSYVGAYIERDVRSISRINDLETFQRFTELTAGRTGDLLNFSSIASDCGITQPTAKAWTNVLEASFVIARLSPFHSNLRKRLVKTPKLHFFDSGLACWLLGIRAPDQLRSHPLRGAIFESWVFSEIVKHRMNHGESGGLWFYRDRDGIEVDLVLRTNDAYLLIEVKAAETATPSLFDSVRRASKIFASPDDRPIRTMVVYGGTENQTRQETRLVSWNRLHTVKW